MLREVSIMEIRLHALNFSKYLVIVVALLTLQFYTPLLANAEAANAKRTGVFSSLKLNPETGDVIGIEITISKCQLGYCAIFQSAEGESRSPVVAKISISKDNKMELFVNEEHGYKGKFYGGISDEGIEGEFDGGALSPDGNRKFFLKRGSSFWNSH